MFHINWIDINTCKRQINFGIRLNLKASSYFRKKCKDQSMRQWVKKILTLNIYHRKFLSHRETRTNWCLLTLKNIKQNTFWDQFEVQFKKICHEALSTILLLGLLRWFWLLTFSVELKLWKPRSKGVNPLKAI